MPDRDPWEQPLYRFAAVLLADPGHARAVVLETLEAAIARPPACADADRLAMHLFREVRRRALALEPAPDDPDSTSRDLPADAEVTVKFASPVRIAAALHSLAEPGRSALALLLLDELESDLVAKLLDLDRAEFAAALTGARAALHLALVPAGTEAAP